MSENFETYPYPLRTSELSPEDLFNPPNPLELTAEENQEIRSLDLELFERIKPLRDKRVECHEIYPAVFLTPIGSKLFSATYLDPEILAEVSRLAEKKGLDLTTKDVERRVFDAYFDDLLSIASSDEEYKKYLKEGAVFPSLTTLLGDGGEQQIILKGNPAAKVFETESDLKTLFYNVNLEVVPRRVQERLNFYSSEWAKEQFKTAFLECRGDIEKVANPVKFGKIVSPSLLYEKLEGLRRIKVDIKEKEKGLGTSNVHEAQKILYGLYRRYINTIIAAKYPLVRLITDNPNPSEKEKQLLLEVFKFFPKKDPDSISRAIERIDHFLKGVGKEFGKKGLYESISGKLEKHSRERSGQVPEQKTDIYSNYNKNKVNSEQAAEICRVVLDYYGLTKGDKPWAVVIYEKSRALEVLYEESEDIREVRIPRKLSRGLVDLLGVIAHEIEGHVMRYANKVNALNENLKIVGELTTGRGGVLSEAAPMYVENRTVREISGFDEEALPYYYVTLQEKRKGGSFKECFKANFTARARREYRISFEDAVENADFFKKIFNKAYSSTLRIFRNNTPLDDTSGYLPDTEQLDYIEQELVTDVLTSERAKEIGLSKLLYVAGIDLYSTHDLTRLGVLALDRVKEPELLVAKYIWPRLKTSLDAGMSLSEAITNLSSSS